MQARHFIAMAVSVAIVASTIALFDVGSRPAKYSIANAPTVVDGLPVVNFAPIIVTPETAGTRARSRKTLHAADESLVSSNQGRPMTGSVPAAGNALLAMPYYSFAKPLVNFSKD